MHVIIENDKEMVAINLNRYDDVYTEGNRIICTSNEYAEELYRGENPGMAKKVFNAMMDCMSLGGEVFNLPIYLARHGIAEKIWSAYEGE